METKIGKITKVSLGELWKRKERDFTKWLEDNIEYLNEKLDFDINVLSREKEVGPFKVDLFAEDQDGNKVIIENQLRRTDHDHLGKLITYLTGLEAKTAIWITSEATDEHSKAIDWLNEVTPDDVSFYLIKVEAIRIGDQPIAGPLFTIVNSPSPESKQLGEARKEDAQRHILRKEFWSQLLEKAKGKTDLHSSIKPGRYSYIGTGAGKTGISYNYVITYDYAGCEIYLDKGKEFTDPNINKSRFDELYRSKDQIEAEFGGNLNWERLNDRRASRISIRFEDVGLKSKDKWDKLQDKMIDAMIKLEKVFKKRIEKLR